MGAVSNNVRACMYQGDITDGSVRPFKDECYTLQHFTYTCHRERDKFGMPYGPSRMSLLKMKIRALPDGSLEDLYKYLADFSKLTFSFIFNAVFDADSDGGLYGYDSASVVSGYIVSIDESVSSGSGELMTVEVELLPSSITHIGDNSSTALLM